MYKVAYEGRTWANCIFSWVNAHWLFTTDFDLYKNGLNDKKTLSWTVGVSMVISPTITYNVWASSIVYTCCSTSCSNAEILALPSLVQNFSLPLDSFSLGACLTWNQSVTQSKYPNMKAQFLPLIVHFSPHLFLFSSPWLRQQPRLEKILLKIETQSLRIMQISLKQFTGALLFASTDNRMVPLSKNKLCIKEEKEEKKHRLACWEIENTAVKAFRKLRW